MEKRVLIVDDSRFWRIVLEGMVKPHVSELFMAEDAMKGIDLALKHFPDVVITDYTMPGLSGLQLCLYLRSIPAFTEAGVAVLTGSDDVINEFWALHSGASRFISKLLPREQLEAELLEFLTGHFSSRPEKAGYVRSVHDVLEQRMRKEILNREILSLIQYARDETYVVNELRNFISFFSNVGALAFLILSPVEGRVYNFGFDLQRQTLKQAIVSRMEKPMEPSNWTFVGTYGPELSPKSQLFVHTVTYLETEVGAIAIQSPEIDRNLTGILNDASESLGLLFNTLNAFRELKVASSVDNLTGLLNKKELFRFLEELHGISKLGKKPYYVAMLDIDDFKKINDTHGHLVGDEVLRNVAKIIRESLPQGAVAGRYGGEEFTLIFSSCQKETVVFTVERILESVRALNLNGVRCTISAGVSCSGLYQSHTEVIKAADDLLYLAKKQGKDRALFAFLDENITVQTKDGQT